MADPLKDYIARQYTGWKAAASDRPTPPSRLLILPTKPKDPPPPPAAA